MTDAAPRGALLLVPNTLDFGTGIHVPLDDVLPRTVITRAAGLAYWVAENAKSARALLKRIDAIVPLGRALQTIEIHELPRPPKGRASSSPVDLAPLLHPALAGHDIGLVSEAGMPAVADPGAALVAAAHDAGIAVQPLVGPSALLLALAASGLNGQSFAFVGYLPVEAAARAVRIRELEAASRLRSQTQIAIETPYRNVALFDALLEQLHPSTLLAVSAALTLPDPFCATRRVSAWRQQRRPPLDRCPAVFLLLAA